MLSLMKTFHGCHGDCRSRPRKFKPHISPSIQERLQLFILSHIQQQNDMLSKRVHTSTARAHKLQLNYCEIQKPNVGWKINLTL